MTPQGYRDIKEKLDFKNIKVIYIYANDTTLKKRLLKRGDDVKEAERRLKHDRDDFKGFENEADRIIYNNYDSKIETIIEKILNVVEEHNEQQSKKSKSLP